VLAVAWGHDGGMIASGSLDGTVRVWSARNWVHLRTLEAGSGVNCVALAPGRRLLAGTLAGGIHVWELDRELAAGGGKP
jgi:WD40 repeat protein